MAASMGGRLVLGEPAPHQRVRPGRGIQAGLAITGCMKQKIDSCQERITQVGGAFHAGLSIGNFDPVLCPPKRYAEPPCKLAYDEQALPFFVEAVPTPPSTCSCPSPYIRRWRARLAAPTGSAS